MTATRKILLAEDDADDQILFNEFLQHRTDILLMPFTENGEELLATLQAMTTDERLPEIIILDQNMPKKNGLQTLQSLKENSRFCHIPVMVYSTYTDQGLINAATQMGATAVITKPISKEGYNEMIDAFLQLLS